MKKAQDTVKASRPQKRKPALQNKIFLQFFSFLWVIFACLEPKKPIEDLCGSGSTELPKF